MVFYCLYPGFKDCKVPKERFSLYLGSFGGLACLIVVAKAHSWECLFLFQKVALGPSKIFV